MTAFSAAYKNETYKLLSRKKYIVFLVIGIVICVGWALLGGVVLSDLSMRSAGFMVNLAPTPMGVLPFFLQIMLPLLIFMAVADLITTEEAEHTMKAMICRPVERWKLYTGKLLAIATYVGTYLGCIFVVSTVLNLMFGRGMDVGEIFSAFVAYALTMLPLFVLISFSALVALMGRSSALVMLLLIASYLAMNVLPVFFPLLSELLFTSYLGWYRIWIGVLPAASRMLHMLLVVFGYGVVFFMAGSLVFDGKEY